jgi:deoxyribonuclease-4
MYAAVHSARVGFHVSIAGGIANSVDNAKRIGCTAFQIFSRTPRRQIAKPLDPKDVELFHIRLAASGITRDSIMVHMPYLPNLSGPKNELYTRSIQTLAEEIERCGDLGIPYLVIHLGSHRGTGTRAGIAQLVHAIASAREKVEKSKMTKPVMLLLENNAGQRNSVGGTFEELRLILDMLNDGSAHYGVCLDTCHLFASGYNLRTTENVQDTLGKFDTTVGLHNLKVVHLNDSKGALGSNLDRHEHIGLGAVGAKGLRAFVNHKGIKELPIILETPDNERRGDEQNLRIALGFISS